MKLEIKNQDVMWKLKDMILKQIVYEKKSIYPDDTLIDELYNLYNQIVENIIKNSKN